MALTNVEGSSQLPVRILSRSLVKASDPSIKPHVTSFTNLDLVCRDQNFFACLYPTTKHPKPSGFDAVIATFKTGLPTLLNHFYPLVGRIVANPSSCVPELHCRNQGAELVVAEVGASLGDLDFRNEASSVQKIGLPFSPDIPLSLQLLSFSGGGFAVVWGVNHLVVDAYTITMVIRMWSQLTRSGKISECLPNLDRSVLRARDLPSYSAEVADMFVRCEERNLVNVLTAHESLVHRLYYVDACDLARLREMASTEGRRASRVQALSAYVWKVLAGVVAASPIPEEQCGMGWWVNGRPWFTGMANYFGNLRTYRGRKAPVEVVRQKSLPDIAAMVKDTIAAVDYGAYIQEHIDWIEQHKKDPLVEKANVGLGPPTINVTVLASFPLDTDFGFGRAALAMPVYGYGRLCTGFMSISPRPGADDDGSWLVNARVWPRLAATLESDGLGIFKPLTAEYLGLRILPSSL